MYKNMKIKGSEQQKSKEMPSRACIQKKDISQDNLSMTSLRGISNLSTIEDSEKPKSSGKK